MKGAPYVDPTAEKALIISKLAPHAYIGFDKQGRPVYYEKIGKLLSDALCQLISIEEYVNSHISGFEFLSDSCFEQSKKLGKVVDTITVVLDLEGLGISHRNAISYLGACSSLDAKYYPHKVAKVLVLNAPWAAHMLWPAVSVLVDSHTRSQLEVCSSYETLQQFIELDHIPKEYGGLSEEAVIIQDASDLLASLSSSNDGYERLNISAGAKESREIVCSNMESNHGIIFSWYFESEGEYDVDFEVALSLSDGTRKILEPNSRCVKSKGEHKVIDSDASFAEGARMVLTWDNTFSWMISKDVKYLASCTPLVHGIKGA